MNFGMETELIEFKKSTGELKEGIISLASMLNKNGRGVLYFGVRNDGEIVGQQIGDRTMREISQGIANAIKPQVIPTIIIELCEDKNIIKEIMTLWYCSNNVTPPSGKNSSNVTPANEFSRKIGTKASK